MCRVNAHNYLYNNISKKRPLNDLQENACKTHLFMTAISSFKGAQVKYSHVIKKYILKQGTEVFLLSEGKLLYQSLCTSGHSDIVLSNQSELGCIPY